MCSDRQGTKAGRLLAALLFCAGATLNVSHAAPYEPRSDQIVLETLPAGMVRRPQVTSQGTSPDTSPTDLAGAATQAASYIEIARTSGDPRYLGYAQAALGPWWKMQRPPVVAALLRAQIRQHNHAFAPALEDLDLVLASEPRNAQARLMRSAIHQVQGNYAAAESDCRNIALLAPPLTTADCLSRVASHRGQAREAYERLKLMRERSSDADVRQLHEVDLTLADIAARLGDAEGAQSHYANALKSTDIDAYMLATFADFLLDQRRFADVIWLAQRYPAFQDLSLRAALAARATSSPDSRTLADRVRAQYAAYRERGDYVPTRDYARYLLDIESDAPAALQAALFNWRTQREPADARIVLRAALAANQPQAADEVVAFVERNALEDPQLADCIARLRRKGHS
jgi:hypothetical protein